MIIKLAQKKLTYSQLSLIHRETGIQYGDLIPPEVMKHYAKDEDKDLYFNMHGLKRRLEKAKKADEWSVRQLP